MNQQAKEKIITKVMDDYSANKFRTVSDIVRATIEQTEQANQKAMTEPGKTVIQQIKGIIDDYACNQDDIDLDKTANEIYHLSRQDLLCPECGANLQVWQDMLGEEHRCPVKSQKSF